MPSARRRSSLARRTASRSDSCSAGAGSPPAGSSGAAMVPATLEADVDLGDLELAGRALGHLDRDDVVALVAQHRAADGRLVGDLVLPQAHLGRADDRELL